MTNRRRESILWLEGIGFGFLVVFSWLTELLHLPHLFFSDTIAGNWDRALARTAVIVLVWCVVHLSTQRLLKRLHHLEEYLLVCAWCRKIGHDDAWMTMEDYFGSAFTTKTTHGVCPACSEALKQSALAADASPARARRVS